LVPALRGGRLAVIAEMKARTPIMGVLAEAYSPARLARLYTEGGAAAISVLTQEASFGGCLEHLAEVRAETGLPILRKDFVVDEYQLLEARAEGADAVLLIVAVLGAERLAALLAAAWALGLEALVETHDEPEVMIAVEAGARVIGINHRDLRSFEVDLSLTRRLRPLVPADRVLVAESGISGPEAAARVRAAGADAILVGETLMRSGSPAHRIRELSLP
jgi:indole-3-glycerol phosphate synthase